MIGSSALKALAPDGRSKTWDASADGYGRGEGCGLVVLKRLSDAQRDGDRIWAVIRGSSTNHGGRTSGFTVPSSMAQADLIRDALRRAHTTKKSNTWKHMGREPSWETRSKSKDSHRSSVTTDSAANPLMIGTVKTNIGHLEAAAGIAGLIKTILAIHHRQRAIRN